MPRPRIPHRRERILEAAEGLILESGFDAMNVQAVADRAGIAKGAVYLEFSSKHEILDVLLRQSMERLYRAADELLQSDTPKLSEAYRVSVKVLLNDPLMTAAFLDDQGVLGSYADTVTDDRYRLRHRAVVEWIERLQRQGAVAADVDAEALGLALSSATIGLLSAAKLLGPLSATQLENALEALATMVATVEVGG